MEDLKLFQEVLEQTLTTSQHADSFIVHTALAFQANIGCRCVVIIRFAGKYTQKDGLCIFDWQSSSMGQHSDYIVARSNTDYIFFYKIQK